MNEGGEKSEERIWKQQLNAKCMKQDACWNKQQKGNYVKQC